VARDQMGHRPEVRVGLLTPVRFPRPMQIVARPAEIVDVPLLVGLYRRLEAEMKALHPMWPIADGLPEPVEAAFKQAIESDDAEVLVGEIEGVPFGFLYARVEQLLPQSPDPRVGSIRLIYTEDEAREVGVAEALRDQVMEMFRARGITKFDAHVLPGHRLAKNFFEAGGFSARSIVMHHDDNPPERRSRDPRPR
jgi:ribosomal protein S18 acetylase RimI-like enzyme